MVFGRLRRMLRDADSVFYYECRDCGTTLKDSVPLACSTCDSMNIARYQLS